MIMAEQSNQAHGGTGEGQGPGGLPERLSEPLSWLSGALSGTDVNVGSVERGVSAVAGGVLAVAGLRRG